jgi:hypothetical protein
VKIGTIAMCFYLAISGLNCGVVFVSARTLSTCFAFLEIEYTSIMNDSTNFC